ncbi:hypothetical protein chiPu_0018306 [Chiloscyllium punctatum]|uniref:FH2 domain-containing protein n=1 Tax=Chiloscyllium punctatum TaxID=137246 RepID=A0A401RMH0_CHIPU|nr:hypothetical protein [Chiloscyllium punctatum]
MEELFGRRDNQKTLSVRRSFRANSPQRNGVEQVKKFQQFDGDRDRLCDSDRFILLLLEISSYKERLESVILKEEFGPRLEGLCLGIRTMTEAARELMDCDELHTVIRLVLKAGNYMNAGGYAGNAVGFRMSSLLKLAETKSNCPGMNLMHFVTMEAEKNDRKLLEFPNRLQNLGAASRLFKQELETEFEKLKQKLQLVKGNLDKQPEICQQMETFIQKAERQLDEVQASVTELQAVSQQLAEYLCEDEEKFKLEEYCQIFQNFGEKFIAATQENKQRALLERKRREREKEEKKAKRISIASCSHMEKDLGGGDLESLLRSNQNSFRSKSSRQREGPIPRSQSLKQIRARSEQSDSGNGSLTRDDAQMLREVSKKLLSFQVGAGNSGQRHKQCKFAQTLRISEEYSELVKGSTTQTNGHAEVGLEQEEGLLGSGASGPGTAGSGLAEVPALGESEHSGNLVPAAAQQPGSPVPAAAQQPGSPAQAAAQQLGGPVPAAAQQLGGPVPAAAQQLGGPVPAAAQQLGGPVPAAAPQPGSLVPAVNQEHGSMIPTAAQQPGSPVPAAAQQPGSQVPAAAHQPGSLVPAATQQSGSPPLSLSGGFPMGMDTDSGTRAGGSTMSCVPDPGAAPSQYNLTPFPLAGNSPDSEQEQKSLSSNLPAEAQYPSASSARVFRKDFSHSFSGDKPRPAARKRPLTRGFSADKVPSSPAVRKFSIPIALKSVKPTTVNKPTQKDEAKAEQSQAWKLSSFFSKKTSKASMRESVTDVRKEVPESPTYGTNPLANFFKRFSDSKTTKHKNPSNATMVPKTDDGSEAS